MDLGCRCCCCFTERKPPSFQEVSKGQMLNLTKEETYCWWKSFQTCYRTMCCTESEMQCVNVCSSHSFFSTLCESTSWWNESACLMPNPPVLWDLLPTAKPFEAPISDAKHHAWMNGSPPAPLLLAHNSLPISAKLLPWWLSAHLWIPLWFTGPPCIQIFLAGTIWKPASGSAFVRLVDLL